MTARLDITRAQVKAIAAAAKETGCTVEVERQGTIYRVIPDSGKGRQAVEDENLDEPEVPEL